jgi:hypothetical protein
MVDLGPPEAHQKAMLLPGAQRAGKPLPASTGWQERSPPFAAEYRSCLLPEGQSMNRTFDMEVRLA